MNLSIIDIFGVFFHFEIPLDIPLMSFFSINIYCIYSRTTKIDSNKLKELTNSLLTPNWQYSDESVINMLTDYIH